MVTKITTTGELRECLADTISKALTGNIDMEVARTVVKTAAQITESIYSELKAQLIMDAAKKLEFGALPLNRTSSNAVANTTED